MRAEPYRFHFPLGASLGLAGLTFWILYALGALTTYPRSLHGQTMVAGFLINFVCGFLMTAVPRMTGGRAASIAEISTTCTLSILTFLIGVGRSIDWAWAMVTAQLISLFVFILRRQRRFNGPGPMMNPFIPLGLISGMTGSFLQALAGHIPSVWLELGRVLTFEALILNLVVGLGSRLIPMLTQKSIAFESRPKLFMIEALFLNLSFILEVFLAPAVGYVLRALVLILVLIANFRILYPAQVRSYLGWGLLMAVCSMPVTYFLLALFPSERIHLIHGVYLVGFAQLTLFVSIRVTLAHASIDLGHERTSPAVLLLLMGFEVMAVLRVFSPIFWPSAWRPLYLSAALAGLLVLLAWLFLFGLFPTKVFRSGNPRP